MLVPRRVLYWPTNHARSGQLNATEVPQESANESWTYPKAFDAALRELYERSFAECALAPGVQAEALQELNAWAGRRPPIVSIPPLDTYRRDVGGGPA